MTHAYSEHYLDDARENLGEMVDYAVNACHLDIDEFWEMFLVSGYAHSFEVGNPKIICGHSGTELVYEVLRKIGIEMEFPKPQVEYDYSPEYWSGWILAYYQWNIGMPFQEIYKYMKMYELANLYHPLHEAPEQKVIGAISERIRLLSYATKLQQLRKASGYSQRELAEKSGVSIRMIQQYETQTKDISKAAGGTIRALANVLGCRMEDLVC
ncbi:helix-turn-helix domain-containing protein [Hespellia stercorisuis]|uniref:Helix-turn-helix n=1 Tax=Hespellia stercorisuis DSM 15480 TaxID=1121950 RepID=A0A1M6K004_9FIRM|nr:helix-turn-helix transcriptional regulator [Hespellia stercorisuis]SHJ52295.1 Helix-turn-helix [Hespellia stercorisuis DSM 15480]